MNRVRFRLLFLAALLFPVPSFPALADPLPGADAVEAPDAAFEPGGSDWCSPEVASGGRWVFRSDDFVRRGHTLVFDAARDRLVLFGGTALYNRGTQSGLPLGNETWVRGTNLLTPWQVLATTGTPPAGRILHVAVFDPVGDRMIVYGGWGPGGYLGFLGDAWQLDFTVDPPRWSEIPVSGPRARDNATAVYDPAGRRMLVYGGYAIAPGSGLQDYTNEIWELALS